MAILPRRSHDHEDRPRHFVATLGCFEGVVLRDVWVNVAGLVRASDGPTALIVGSAIELEQDGARMADVTTIRRICQEVAEELVQRGYNLVSNGSPGVPDMVMSRFTSVPGAERGVAVQLSVLLTPADDSSRHGDAPDGFPIGGDLTVFCNVPFPVLSTMAPQICDVVVVVGGGLGTVFEASASVMADLPIVCHVGGLGASTVIDPLFQSFTSRYRNLDVRIVANREELSTTLKGIAEGFDGAGRRSRLLRGLVAIRDAERAGERSVNIEVARGLETATYRWEGHSHQVSNPTLVRSGLEAPFVAIGAYHVFHAALSEGRSYAYDGVEVKLTAHQVRTVWGPSIDTFLLLEALAEIAPPATALDVGCGSGIIALWMAARWRAAEILGIDHDEAAVVCSLSNASSLLADGRSIAFVHEDFAAWEPPTGGIDLVVANPPSIPAPPGGRRAPSAFGGTALLVDLLQRLDRLVAPGGRAVLVLSRAAHGDPVVSRRLTELEHSGRGRRISETTVPFAVSYVLSDDDWLQHLVDAGAVTRDDQRPHPYSHVVEVWDLHPG